MAGADDDTFGDDVREPVADRSPDTYVVRIKGQPYAVGLIWNNIDDKSKAAAEAREVAARPNIDADLFCIRQAGNQYGLGRKADGHAKNMVSLGGAMAEARGGNWIGVFEAAEGFYLLAVRDDDILAQTDVFLSEEMDARTKIDDLLDLAEWEQVFAPASFGLPDSSELLLEDAIGRARGPRLQDVNRIGSMARVVIGGAIVLLLAGGGMFYLNYQSELDAQAALDALSQSFENTVGGSEEEIVIPPMPWEGMPTTAAYIEACQDGMSKALFSVPGWETVGLACEGDSVRMALDRSEELGKGGGTINWIRWALDERGLQNASATPIGDNRIEVTWSLGEMEKYPVEIQTARLSDGRRYLQSALEETFTPVVFPNTESTEFVSTMDFKFISSFDPSEFAPILSKVPGMTIERVVLDLKKFEYNVEGSIYEELPLPEKYRAASAD